MKTSTIVIAVHKPYRMPEDSIYLPLHVGAEGKTGIGFTPDNTGDNISEKNPYFCELTGLYWAWKNLNSDYVGLAHYRRHFTVSSIIPKDEEHKFEVLLTGKQLDELEKKADVILPKKRNYYIENLYSHYEHTMFIEPLDITGEIIKEKYPSYVAEFERLHKRTSAHMFNMLIMRKDILDSYCRWLFDILFELEKRVDVSEYDAFHARFFGRVSELLLDVWINTNKVKYEEIRVIDMQRVNWIKKGMSFLAAKFGGRKYDKSF